ncbi:MAG: hypothetical protein LBQ42_12675 [Synergistaceae bacterium]|jgi:uncharacterized membrane protein YkvI|nr:hypothetical protein [Synergistaceae bacterium]
METKKHSKFQRYVLPGLIFQSVVIAGGYGTGAELAEFFFPYGSLGGLLAMSTVTFLFWAVVCAVTFEFARVFQTYEYKSFFQTLLGKGWVLYEICYVILLLIVLAVVVAAAGANTEAVLGVSKWYGVVVMGVCVALLVLRGTTAIEKFLSFWSYVLYAVYILFLAICFTQFGEAIAEQLGAVKEIGAGWAMGGARYAFYNLGIIPAVLFATRDAESRAEAVGSGLIAGAIGILPAILLFVAMTGMYPEIASVAIPVNYIFEKLNMPWLQYLFQIVLFGTLIETGAGFIKAVTDRLEINYTKEGKQPPAQLRPAVTVGCVLLGVAISSFGLTGLIAQGYGTITWGFFVLYVVPVLTWGVYKIATAKKV